MRQREAATSCCVEKVSEGGKLHRSLQDEFTKVRHSVVHSFPKFLDGTRHNGRTDGRVPAHACVSVVPKLKRVQRLEPNEKKKFPKMKSLLSKNQLVSSVPSSQQSVVRPDQHRCEH